MALVSTAFFFPLPTEALSCCKESVNLSDYIQSYMHMNRQLLIRPANSGAKVIFSKLHFVHFNLFVLCKNHWLSLRDTSSSYAQADSSEKLSVHVGK